MSFLSYFLLLCSATSKYFLDSFFSWMAEPLILHVSWDQREQCHLHFQSSLSTAPCPTFTYIVSRDRKNREQPFYPVPSLTLPWWLEGWLRSEECIFSCGEPWFCFQHSHGVLQLYITPGSGYPVYSFSFWEHQAHVQCTYRCARKALIHIIKRCKSWEN